MIVAWQQSAMPKCMDTDVPSFPNLNRVEATFHLKALDRWEVSSCWQQDMNFCIWSFHFQTSEGGSAKSLIIDHPIWSVLHRAPEKWLTGLSLTCSLTCPAGAERTHCGVETTGHLAPLATRCNPGFCCSRQSGRSRTGESRVGRSGISRGGGIRVSHSSAF